MAISLTHSAVREHFLSSGDRRSTRSPYANYIGVVVGRPLSSDSAALQRTSRSYGLVDGLLVEAPQICTKAFIGTGAVVRRPREA